MEIRRINIRSSSVALLSLTSCSGTSLSTTSLAWALLLWSSLLLLLSSLLLLWLLLSSTLLQPLLQRGHFLSALSCSYCSLKVLLTQWAPSTPVRRKPVQLVLKIISRHQTHLVICFAGLLLPMFWFLFPLLASGFFCPPNRCCFDTLPWATRLSPPCFPAPPNRALTELLRAR